MASLSNLRYTTFGRVTLFHPTVTYSSIKKTKLQDIRLEDRVCVLDVEPYIPLGQISGYCEIKDILLGKITIPSNNKKFDDWQIVVRHSYVELDTITTFKEFKKYLQTFSLEDRYNLRTEDYKRFLKGFKAKLKKPNLQY